MAAYTGPYELGDDDVALEYQSTNGGRRVVIATKSASETVMQFKARHDAMVAEEMAAYPPKFPG